MSDGVLSTCGTRRVTVQPLRWASAAWPPWRWERRVCVAPHGMSLALSRWNDKNKTPKPPELRSPAGLPVRVQAWLGAADQTRAPHVGFGRVGDRPPGAVAPRAAAPWGARLCPASASSCRWPPVVWAVRHTSPAPLSGPGSLRGSGPLPSSVLWLTPACVQNLLFVLNYFYRNVEHLGERAPEGTTNADSTVVVGPRAQVGGCTPQMA